MVRRGFWVALGAGAGATGAVIASRWARKQSKRMAPATLAREAKGGFLDLGKLVSESIAEGRQAMEERERELRAKLPTTSGDDASDDEPSVDSRRGDPPYP